jgi:hypothetical protein
MDPTHHEKIVDKLMQYRGKIPKTGQLADKKAQFTADQMRIYIDDLIANIDAFATCYEKGLIR